MIAERQIRSTCPFCGVGCQVDLHLRDDVIYRVSAPYDAAPNYGMLCVKGRFGTDYVSHPSRLRKPLIRVNTHEPRSAPPVWREAEWEEALNLVADRLAAIARELGGDSIAAFACAKATNEDNYLLQKMMRAVLGTNNVDHCSRLCHAGSVAGLQLAIGSSAMSNSIAEMEHLDTFIVTGSNTTETHPVISNFLKRAVRQNGAKLIVLDPRKIEMTDFATLWLRQHPGTDVAVWQAMAHVVVKERLYNSDFIQSRTEGFSDYVESLEAFTPEWAESISGVPAEDIRQAARMYAKAGAAAVYWGMGISQSSHGTDNTLAITNLALMCGHLGREGTGLNPLRGQNNVQGCSDSGGLPYVFTAYQRVDDNQIRARFAREWNRPELSATPGLMITELADAALAGAVRAFYVMGEDPLTSEPNLNHARHALEKLDFLVCQDIFLNTTGELADVVLPSVSFAEKDGTFTNSDRRIQRVRTAVPPIGDSRPDWQIVCDLATRLESRLGQSPSAGFRYSHPSEIWEEMRRLTPDFGGIDYERLEREGGVHWPCPTVDHPGSPYLFQDSFPRGRGKFWKLEYGTDSELPDATYPFILSTGRVLYHWHGGTMSRRSKLDEIWPEATVELNPLDAERLGLQTGDWAEVASRRGAIRLRVMVTGRSPEGTVFIPFHFVEAAANLLTLDRLDPRAKIPDFKVCAVRLSKIEAPAGRDPDSDQPLDERGAIKDQAALVH
ncbi:MAG TPA: formate dehydrogenase subunit alpha [Anaerolineales bacterium]|nr:formate dehydrogenase subunit alpha [Anaerolineales bacterium]